MEMTDHVLPPKIQNWFSTPEKERQRYVPDYIGMFEYDDGSKSILLPVGKNTPPNLNEDFRDFKGKLNVITEVIGIRHTKEYLKTKIVGQI